MSSVTRITGYNSGLDVESIVTSTMKPYKARIDKEVQNKKVLEYQQEQYQKIMSDASDFYDKYFDILKTGSLRRESSYQTQKYKSGDESKVTAKGYAGANLDNYKVAVTQLATKASDKLADGVTGLQTMKIGTATVSFKAGYDGKATVENYNKAVEAEKKRLSDLVTAGTNVTANKAQLDDLNANTITASYSEFTKSVTFTASAFGGSGFTLNSNAKAEDKYLEATIQNNNGDVYTITNADKKTSNSITIDNVAFDFKGMTTGTSVAAGAVVPATHLNEEKALTHLPALTIPAGVKALTDGGTNTTKIVTEEDGTQTKTITSADGKTTTTIKLDKDGKTIGSTTENKSVDGKTITTINAGADGKTTQFTIKQESVDGQSVTTTVINSGGTTTTKARVDGTETITTTAIKDEETSNVTTTTTFTSTRPQADGTIPLSKQLITDGTTAQATITLRSADGKTTTTQNVINNGGTKTSKTITEKDTANGSTTTVEEKVNGVTTKTITTDYAVNPSTGATTKTVQIDSNAPTATEYSSVPLTGETDITTLKDKIVAFVNDYNTFLQSINTKLYEARDKDYMPLTDEQKKGMTETQITAWEKKAQTGLLRRDSDLERIRQKMKTAMSSLMSGTGLSLEAIGIKPIDDYKDKNGMLVIDEDKLTTALENNPDGVKDLFTRAASDTTTNKGGVITQLSSIIYSEFKSSTSSLSKKAGLLGSSTETDNTIAKSIYTKKKLIDKLNTAYAEKENALYKKYSALETAMQQLNSQQSSLASMLGQS